MKFSGKRYRYFTNDIQKYHYVILLSFQIKNYICFAISFKVMKIVTDGGYTVCLISLKCVLFYMENTLYYIINSEES